LLALRGPERTFAAIADLWPDAPLYTLLYDEAATDREFAHRDVHSSLLQGREARQRGANRRVGLFPAAIRRLPLHQHDLIVSSSTGFALGAHHRDDAVHVCYCHSPFRYAWQDRDEGLANVSRLKRPFTERSLNLIRRADLKAAARVTDFVANSALTRERIAEFYDRESTIIHPPVEVDRFESAEPEDYFLVVAELLPHKRVELALEAAKLAGKRIKVVGSGPEYRRLLKSAGEAAEFDRRLRDEELASLYAGALALIVPNVEEFGIAAVEAQAAGRPVLGIDAGGLQETVVQGETGVLVSEQTAEALAEALTSVDFTRFDSAAISAHAQQFALARFEREMTRHVAAVRSSHE
jgi:glycosyltransferase involved in cell wall biosynthesis